jgi:polyferredoxin
MNTLFRPLGWMYGKLGIKRFRTPGFLKRPAFRYAFLAVFALLMIVTRKLGLDIHLPALLLALSFLVTFFFEEALWHDHVCPYGTILNVTSRKAVKSEKIDEAACISCGKCRTVCPVRCIDIVADTRKMRIRTPDCLACHACEAVCPATAISYR